MSTTALYGMVQELLIWCQYLKKGYALRRQKLWRLDGYWERFVLFCVSNDRLERVDKEEMEEKWNKVERKDWWKKKVEKGRKEWNMKRNNEKKDVMK